MAKKKPASGAPSRSAIAECQIERSGAHPTRLRYFRTIRELLGQPAITYFTSTKYPVIIDDRDVPIIEDALRTEDTRNGFCLIINSHGGSGLAAERIVNLCRSYSGTGKFTAIVPWKAKSAATMICFGADKIVMGIASELGPVDPQLLYTDNDGNEQQFALYNVVKSYDSLFKGAVNCKGNLEPYLQQLQRYDGREIEEFRSHLELTTDYTVKTLKTGMMRHLGEAAIRKKIKKFLDPSQKKVHARPIFRDEAKQSGLKIEFVDTESPLWDAVYDLYVRTDAALSQTRLKIIESEKTAWSL